MSVSILQGDIFERLADLPADHFACALSSPPYWGLRRYTHGENVTVRFKSTVSLGDRARIERELAAAGVNPR